MKDKLSLKIEIQGNFNGETISNINKAITISKIIRFLYKKSTIFFISLIPMLLVGGYSLIVDKNPFVGIVLVIMHYPFYRFFVKGFVFKNSKETVDEFEYTLEVLKEIKSSRI
jgi:hypothetical protein